MLERLSHRKTNAGREPDSAGAKVRIKEAVFPTPFESHLEFNAPAHGSWNIVHIGMLIPEAHQIYICADNCMRGVVLTAAEMGAAERFSSVVLEEHDLYDGNLEEITIEGVTDVLEKLAARDHLPPAVLVFPVCLHHFMGTDMERVYAELEQRFPEVHFVRCWMDPIMQKTGLTPDQKERRALPDMIEALPENPRVVCMMNDNLPLQSSSDLMQILSARGFALRQVQDMTYFREYLQMGEGALFITRSAPGLVGTERFARRLGRKFLYLPPAPGYDEITEELELLEKALDQLEEAAKLSKADSSKAYVKCGIKEKPSDMMEESAAGRKKWLAAQKAACDAALDAALQVMGNTPIAIDYMAVNRPLGLARLLTEHGFVVKAVYLDAVSPEEEKDFCWLQEHLPELLLCSTNHVKMRKLHKAFQGIKSDTHEAAENIGASASECAAGNIAVSVSECAAENIGASASECETENIAMRISENIREVSAENREKKELLAIGPKAAWFEGTEYFVNLIDYGGMWGFDGIQKLAGLMIQAWQEKKDVREIIPRKGWGCDCIL